MKRLITLSATTLQATLGLSILCGSGCIAPEQATRKATKRLHTELDSKLDPSQIIVLQGTERDRQLQEAKPYLESMKLAARQIDSWFDVSQSTVFREVTQGLVWIEPPIASEGDQHVRGAVILRAQGRAEAFLTRYVLDPSGKGAGVDALVFDEQVGSFVPWDSAKSANSCTACVASTSRWLGLTGDLATTTGFWAAGSKACPAAVAATAATGPGAVAVGIACFAAIYVAWDLSASQYHKVLQSWIAPSTCKLLSRCGGGAGSMCTAKSADSGGWQDSFRLKVTAFEAEGQLEWRKQWRAQTRVTHAGQVLHPLDFIDAYVGPVHRPDAERLWAPRWWRSLRRDAAVHQDAAWMTPDKHLRFHLRDKELDDAPSFTFATGDKDRPFARLPATCTPLYD